MWLVFWQMPGRIQIILTAECTAVKMWKESVLILKSQPLENAGNNQAEVNLGAVTVPDTIVDRICRG